MQLPSRRAPTLSEGCTASTGRECADTAGKHKQTKHPRLRWGKAKTNSSPAKSKEPRDNSGRESDGDGHGGVGEQVTKRLGHYKVDKYTGEVAYKRVRSSELQESIQLGIRIAVGSVVRRPPRDLLFTDFQEVESLHFPKCVAVRLCRGKVVSFPC